MCQQTATEMHTFAPLPEITLMHEAMAHRTRCCWSLAQKLLARIYVGGKRKRPRCKYANTAAFQTTKTTPSHRTDKHLHTKGNNITD